jgi:hypothetical protein
MNESPTNQEGNDTTSKAKLFGLPLPLIGASAGILFFLLIEFLLWRADLWTLALGLNYLGLFITPLIHIHLRQVEVLIFYGISSIPFAVAGSLFSSKSATQKISGAILLAIHATLWIISSIFFSVMAD